mgnify:CR=1 FL=1
MPPKPDPPLDVLLIEDNPGDADLVAEALVENESHVALHVVSDGEAALEYLERRNGYAGAPLPRLILLDWNLPRLSGERVLERIKANGNLRSIPVIVLTSSRAPQDIDTAYRLHANCYVSKPGGFDAFVELVRQIEHFWVSVAEIPR